MLGLPTIYLSLISMAINQTYPYLLSVGILDTEIWSTDIAPVFYIEVRDSYDFSANVTVSVTKDTCTKSESTDKSFDLRAYERISNTDNKNHFLMDM